MINNQWYAVMSSHEIRKGRVVGARRFGENLVQADKPIIEYRSRRDKLQKRLDETE
jgi:hypothetical protein